MGLFRVAKLQIYFSCLAILLSGFVAAPIRAQIIANSSNETESVGETSILPQPDRETLKQLNDARLLVEKERFGEAVRILGNILRLPEDSFFTSPVPTAEGGDPSPAKNLQIRGLHDEAEQILSTLPPRAKELYELQFGAQAKHLLEEAVQNGDTHAPADISRRFFHTDAGAEATWLAGLISMDEGRWKSAVLAFDRLKKIPKVASRYEPLLSFLKVFCMNQAGGQEAAEATWQTLRQQFPEARIRLAEKTMTLFSDPTETWDHFLARTGLSELKTLEDLGAKFASDQTLPFGTPQRNTSVDAGLPLLKQIWRTRITDRPLAENTLQKRREACIDNGKISIPRFYPLVVDGTLFGRTLDTLIAVDITTGKRRWEAAIDKTNETSENFLSSNGRPSNFLEELVSRIWDDSIFGQLSSDGQNVYAIEDFIPSNADTQRQPIPNLGIRRGIVALPNNNMQNSGPCNALVAFDTKTGQRRWTLSTGLDDSPLFFLGPPLPLDGSLYALAENVEEIYLVAIAAASGKIDWTQRIAIKEAPHSRHRNIRYQQQDANARMPAVADGIMVCPTGSGAIIAMEPTTRTLLWAYCYRRLGKRQNRAAFVNRIPRLQNQNRIGEELLLHDGRVFSVPADSNDLYCLDLNTGKELWKKNFSKGTFLGGVYKDRLLVVGLDKFQTIDIENGKEIDTCRLKESLGQDDAVMTTGCGFRNQGIYYAPTSSHHIVAFDIEKGEITQQTYTHEPIVLGNLVAAEDRIFSQSLDGIEAFRQLESVRSQTEKRLRENPDDLHAIAMQGELLLAEEKVDEAIEKFRYVHRTQPTPASGARLLDAFCIALKQSYPQYRNDRPEIESLLQTESQKSRYWYLCICGEMAENNLDAAIEACFKLAGLTDGSPSMLTGNRHHTVRQDRFVQAQLATIYNRLDSHNREKLAQKILDQFQAGIKSGDMLDLHHAWNCYASLPPVVDRYLQVVDSIWEIDPALAERILERTIRFGDPREAATAMVRWAELLRASGRLDDAAACYRQALGQWKEIPLLSDSRQTPYAKVAAMPPNDPVRRRLVHNDTWPKKHQVEKLPKTESPNRSNNIHRQNYLIPIGRPSPLFQDKQIFLSGRDVLLLDEYHREIGKVSIAEEGASNTIYRGTQKTRCSTLGHMILLELPDRLIAIDAWNIRRPKIAWQTKRGTSMNLSGMNTASSHFGRGHFPGFTSRNSGYNHTLLGVPGIDFGFQFLTLSGTELIALDPFDGTTLWSQRKIPGQIDLNSNGTTLFVSQPNRHDQPTISMRLVDGNRYDQTQEETTKKEKMERKASEVVKKIFMRNTRPPQKILSTGRNILVFNRVQQKYHFTMVDCLTQKSIWDTKKYGNQSRWGLLDQAYIGVLGPEGKFRLFRISDGKVLIRQTLKLDGPLLGVYLQNLGDRVGVIVSTNPKTNQNNSNTLHLPLTQYVRQGRFYTFYWDGRPAMPGHKDGILITQQGFLNDPPAKLPVITLISQNYNPQASWTTKFQVLDSRSGNTILSEEIAASIQTFNVVGDPDQKNIKYQLNDQNFSIQFN